ncbi:MAG: ArsR/SmtB family transcription factor [Yoonia sp.]|uniref:ArsR/SmtB family transcription factor n=1 Tax=Yoonia sp. TaxID=2212373 RepID=UPI003EF45A86
MIVVEMDIEDREEQAALMLSALGHAHRLRIYRLLVRAGPAGLPVGDIQRHVGIPASTLSHHIAALKEAHLISQHRAGRTIFSCANFDLMDGLLAYLTDECCADSQTGDKPCRSPK